MWARRPFGLFACILLSLLETRVVVAEEDTKRACAAAYESAQRLMRSGSLIEARKKLVLCGGPQCPETMHADCQQWLTAVETSTPTLVFQVSATEGPPPKQVLLAVDGGAAVELDGLAVSFDPGEHEVTLTASGYRTSRIRLVISEGEKLRREAVTLAPVKAVVHTTPAERPRAEGSRFTLPVVVASSVAVLAGVGAVYFGIRARADDRNLDRCESSCSRATTDNVWREYLLTNLSIGLAVAGATTAAVLLLVQGRQANQPTSTVVGIAVGPTGVGPVLAGRF